MKKLLKMTQKRGFYPVFVYLVEMTGFEPAASTSRTWRSTKLSHISLMIFSLFSVSGQTCGQTTYIGVVIELIIAQKCSVFKGFRRFCKFYARNRQFAPEPSALPNCATPRISYQYIIHRFCLFVKSPPLLFCGK